MTAEPFIVAAIVAGCAFYFVRRLYLTFSGKSGGSCGCSDCPSKKPSEKVTRI